MKQKPKQKTTMISALTARTQLGQIMERAAAGKERFLVGRRGQPAIVIMGIRDYEDVASPAPDWLSRAWREAEAAGVDKLTFREIDREVKAYRKAQRRQPA